MGKGFALNSVVDLLEPGELAHLKVVAGWLNRPFVGVVIDEVRRQHGRYEINGTHKINRTKRIDDYHGSFSDEVPGPLEILIQKEAESLLLEWVGGLPPRQQEVLHMRMDGLSNIQIADQLGCTVWNIEYHMKRAKREWEAEYGC